jgi:hypothetical protein
MIFFIASYSLSYCFDHALHLCLEFYPHHSLVFFREFFAGFYEDNRKSMFLLFSFKCVFFSTIKKGGDAVQKLFFFFCLTFQISHVSLPDIFVH